MNKNIYMAVKRICCILTIILSILSAQIKSYTKPEINKIFEDMKENKKNILDREGKKYFVEFDNGEAKKPLKEIGKSKETGTQITFLPSKEKIGRAHV